MIATLLRLIASEPQLLADHAQAYAELAGDETGQVAKAWTRRAALFAAALCGLGLACILAGVALMLWAVVPVAQMPAPWALIVVPLPALVLAGACLWAARTPAPGAAFGKLRQQLQADLVLLREVSAA